MHKIDFYIHIGGSNIRNFVIFANSLKSGQNAFSGHNVCALPAATQYVKLGETTAMRWIERVTTAQSHSHWRRSKKWSDRSEKRPTPAPVLLIGCS